MLNFFYVGFFICFFIVALILVCKTYSHFFCEKCGSVFTFNTDKRNEEPDSPWVTRVSKISKCLRCGHEKVLSSHTQET